MKVQTNKPVSFLQVLILLLCLSAMLFTPLLSIAENRDIQDVQPGRVHKNGFVPMVEIPAGSFMMGSPESELDRYSNEVLHKVEISRRFLIGQYEVTQGQWKEIMGTNPSYFQNCGSDCPVESVSWYEAVIFCNRLSDKEGFEKCYEVEDCTGTLGGGCSGSDDWCVGDYECGEVHFKGLDCKGYRLPTESEWEYAARAGSSTAIYTGELTIKGYKNGPELDNIAWYGGNSGVDYEGGWDCSDWSEKARSSTHCGTHPVGKKKANLWNIYDVLGNVWEWTWDYHDSYPGDVTTDPVGPSTGFSRVCRGGGWGNGARNCRSANRDRIGPINRITAMGFRLSRSL